MKLISVKENPEYMNQAISFFQNKWASEQSMMVYEDCIIHCISSPNPLPQWYLLMDETTVIGCAGLITNDFISRMDHIHGYVRFTLKKNTEEMRIVLF